MIKPTSETLRKGDIFQYAGYSFHTPGNSDEFFLKNITLYENQTQIQIKSIPSEGRNFTNEYVYSQRDFIDQFARVRPPDTKKLVLVQRLIYNLMFSEAITKEDFYSLILELEI